MLIRLPDGRLYEHRIELGDAAAFARGLGRAISANDRAGIDRAIFGDVAIRPAGPMCG